MTQFYWADGYHAPKGLDVEQVGVEVEKHPDPTNLLEASKKPRDRKSVV